MTKSNLPTPEELRKLLRYDSETGKLFWKFRDESLFKSHREFIRWNNRYYDKPALNHLDEKGYRCGAIKKKKIRAHRAIWAIIHDEWPKTDIDHINCNRSDNRESNLRLATRAENSWNSGIRATNTSGAKCVSFSKRMKKWTSYINVNGKKLHLGTFYNKHDAAKAHAAAVVKYHGEFGRIK